MDGLDANELKIRNPCPSVDQYVESCVHIGFPCPGMPLGNLLVCADLGSGAGAGCRLMLGGASIGCLFKEVKPDQARECVERAVEKGIRFVRLTPTRVGRGHRFPRTSILRNSSQLLRVPPGSHFARQVDTAPWYGAGLSETRLGEALSARPDVKISTKCGRIILPKGSLQIVQDNHIEKDYEGHFYTDNYHSNRVCWTYTGEGIRESQSQSATRLQREVIDCLRLHDAENKERFTEATAPGSLHCLLLSSAAPPFLLIARTQSIAGTE